MPLIPESRRQRHVDLWVQGQHSLQSSRTARVTEKPCLDYRPPHTKKKKIRKKKKQKSATYWFFCLGGCECDVYMCMHVRSRTHTQVWVSSSFTLYLISWKQSLVEPRACHLGRLASHWALRIHQSPPPSTGVIGSCGHAQLFLRGCWKFDLKSLCFHLKH